MPFFSKVFKSKDDATKKSAPVTNGTPVAKKQWSDAWIRTRVDPEEVAELLHACTKEIKSRGRNLQVKLRQVLTRHRTRHSLPVTAFPAILRPFRSQDLCAKLFLPSS